ncbi:orotidine-5'-phosphate decarboxylase [candidate division WOR-3 bacterium]|nr:orotidine-5'-phosphate decarboxylase [candidate division WOR-3 bacterium]MCK4526963.1 orotidine-5'-phosphate decarboxylase [candidate division WOR-3 bacterium]
MKKDANEYLIVALDVPDIEEAEKVVTELGDTVVYYKVGLQLFIRFGNRAIEFLKSRNKKVFLDLKLHDIPYIVAGAMEGIVDMDVDMVTIHALGGFEMMEAAQKMVWERKTNKPIVLGVTILTSLDEAFLNDFLGVDKKIGTQIMELAILAQSAGLGGVVASPEEVSYIKEHCGKDFVVVTPGIRPKGVRRDDQKRVNTPKKAISSGADFIVIGRPIIKAEDRRKVALAIQKDIRDGLRKIT